MEGIRLDEINYDNHINKCRICFKSFASDEHWIDINKTVEKKFYQMTQTNVSTKIFQNLFKLFNHRTKYSKNV